jgi:hypothetical protein
MREDIAPPLSTSGALAPGKELLYPLDRRFDGLQSRSGCWGVEKNLLPLPGIEPRLLLYRRVILAPSIEKQMRRMWAVLRTGKSNEVSCFIKGREFLD